MLKRLIYHSLFYAIGPQLPKILGLLILPFITPYLDEYDFGVWGTVTAFAVFFYSARDLGLTIPLLNAYIKHKSNWRWVWAQIIWYLFLWGLLLSIVQGATLWFIFPSEGIEDRLIVILLFSIQMIFFDLPILLAVRLCQLEERPQIITIVSLVAGIFSVSSHYVLVVNYGFGYMGWFYSSFLSTLISAIIYFKFLKSKKIFVIPIIREKFLKPRLKIALPMLPHNYSSYLLNTSDRAVMKLLKTPTRLIGIYNAAYIVGNYVDYFGNAIGMAIGPTYLKLYNQKIKNYQINELTRLLQISFITISFIAALWSKEFFQFFVRSEGLEGAYNIAVIIVMSYSYRPLYWSIVNRIQYDENTSILWKISFSAGVLNVLLNVLLIPKHGFQVAAYTTFFSLLYLGFIGHFIYTKVVGIKGLELLMWLFFIIVSTYLVFILKDTSIIYKCIITLLTILIGTLFSWRKAVFVNQKLKL